MLLSEATIGLLACPVCLARLTLAETHVDCTVCGRRYPIIDQLPVLIESRATFPRGDGAGST